MPNSDTNTTPFQKLLRPKRRAALYWTILPQKEKLYVLMEHIDWSEKTPSVKSTVVRIRRNDALRQVRQLPEERELDTVTVILADDYEDHAGYSLLQDLIKLAQTKGFTVQSMIVPRTTDEVIATLSPETSLN